MTLPRTLSGLGLLLILLAPMRAGEITGLAFLPDGKSVVAVTQPDGYLCFCDATTGQEQKKVVAHPGGAFGLARSPDGKTFATCGADRTVKLWSVEQGTEIGAFRGHSGAVDAVTFAPDGKTAASSGGDGIRLWSVETRKELQLLATGDGRVTSLSFSPDGKTLATAGTRTSRFGGASFYDSDDIRLWDVASGKQTVALPMKGWSVSFSSDGRRLLAGGYGVYLAKEGEAAPIRINQMSFKPMNRIVLWDVAAGKEVSATEQQGTAGALMSDGRYFVTGAGSVYQLNRHQGGGIRLGTPAVNPPATLWESATGKQVRKLPVGETATILVLSPTGSKLALGGRDGRIQIVDLRASTVTETNLAKLWETLGESDASAAYDVIAALSKSTEMVAFLKDHLKPVKWDRARVKKLIDDLDSDDFDTREKSAAELRRLGSDAEADLKARMKEELPAEQRRAIKDLVDALSGQTIPPADVRLIRAVDALERAATPAARDLLKALAAGEAEARLTREARLALQRLGGN